MKRVLIDNIFINANDYVIEKIVSEPTDNELLKITFTTIIIGKAAREKLEDTLSKNVLQFRVQEDDLEINAKKVNSSYSYSNGQYKNDEDIRYNYTIVLQQLDKDLPEEWNGLAELGTQVIMNWIRTRSISELLIDKGIFTFEEYDNKISELAKRDYEDLRKYIFYGFSKNKK